MAGAEFRPITKPITIRPNNSHLTEEKFKIALTFVVKLYHAHCNKQ